MMSVAGPITRVTGSCFGRRYGIRRALYCAAGLVFSIGVSQVVARSGPTQVQTFDCKQLVERAQKLKSAAIDMLNTVREQRKRAEGMREALGPDVAEEFHCIPKGTGAATGINRA